MGYALLATFYAIGILWAIRNFIKESKKEKNNEPNSIR